jgi:hypothetical protein
MRDASAPNPLALDLEVARLGEDLAAMSRDETAQGENHRRYSYLSRGRYSQQLEGLYRLLPREQILVLLSEALFADPAAELAKVCRFPGLSQPQMAVGGVKNAGEYRRDIEPSVENRLRAYFAEANRHLEELLGWRLPW